MDNEIAENLREWAKHCIDEGDGDLLRGAHDHIYALQYSLETAHVRIKELEGKLAVALKDVEHFQKLAYEQSCDRQTLESRLDKKQLEFDRLLARDTDNLKRLIECQSRLDAARSALAEYRAADQSTDAEWNAFHRLMEALK